MSTIFFVAMGLLLCAVISWVYWVLVCMEMSAAFRRGPESPEAEDEGERGGERGLTAEELERLEEGKLAVGGGGVCAVCRDDMVEAHAMRVLPGCRHTFHRSCVDAWLRRQPVCPLCRAHLLPPPPSLPPSTQNPAPTPR